MSTLKERQALRGLLVELTEHDAWVQLMPNKTLRLVTAKPLPAALAARVAEMEAVFIEAIEVAQAGHGRRMNRTLPFRHRSIFRSC